MMNTHQSKLRSWIIYDYAVLYLLHINGFEHKRHGFAYSPHMDIVVDRYLSDIPIEDNERYELPDGFIIEAHGGIELRATKRQASI